MLWIPEAVMFVINTLEKAGFEAYMVGGSVRDALLGNNPQDFDIATSALPDDVKSLFERTVDIGIRHGTVAVVSDGEKVEITTYRIDGQYLDGRRPETVEFASSIQEDLSRRDFTINAIAYSPERGFCDPFGGLADISQRVIRCVGDSHIRFSEDALRMVRSVRFSATLGFSVHGDICAAICRLAKRLEMVSAERICAELSKLILGDAKALSIADETGLLPYILRGSLPSGRSIEEAARLVNACPHDLPMRLALLLMQSCHNHRDVLKNLKFDTRTVRTIETYLSCISRPIAPTKAAIKRILGRVEVGTFDNILEMKKILAFGDNIDEIWRLKNEIIENGECFCLKQLAIDGHDLVEQGIESGRHMGMILEKLSEMVIEDPRMNNRALLIKAAKYIYTKNGHKLP